MTALSFDIFTRDKGTAAAFKKIAENAEASGTAIAKATKVSEAAAAKATRASDSATAASARLQRAQTAEANALGRLRVAEQKLAEVRTNSKAKASQIAAAEEALAAAQRKSAASSGAVKSAQEALTAAQRKATTATEAAKTASKELADTQSQAFDKVEKKAEKTGRTTTKALKGIGDKSDDTGKRFGFLAARSHGLTAGMTAGFGKVAAAMGAVAVVSVFKGFIDEARESRKVAALSESIIQSTGGAAKISAKQVGELATSISNKTGVDDEAIQSGSNLLLTFKNVRNEVGKGANVFDRATQAAVDLSAAGFGDVNSASKMLGKALNDPLKGLTALGKAGVTFTEDQKKQIKTLVETGKTLEAQKIILQEVESQVGGAAAAAADPMAKLGVIIGNTKEAIGTAFLPIVDKAATVLGNVIPAALGKASMGLKAMGAAFRGEGITSDGFVGVMERIGVVASRVFNVFKTVALPRLREFGGFVTGTIVPKLSDFLGFVTKWPGKVISGLTTGFKTGNWGPLGQSIGDGFISSLKGISGTIDKIGTAVGDLFDKVDWGKLGGKISGAIRGMLANVDWKGLGETLGDSVITIFQRATTLGEKIGKSFKELMDKVDWKNIGRDSTKSIGNFISGIDWAQLSKTLGMAVLKSLKFNYVVFNTVTQSAADLIMGMAEEIGRAIGRWFSGAGRWLEAKGKELVSGLKTGASSEAKSFGTWISQSVIQPVVSPFRNAGKWLISHGRELITGLKSGIWEFAKGLDDWMTRAPVAKLLAPWHGAIKWLLGPGKNVIGGLLKGVGDAAKNIGNWVGRNVISPTVGMFTKAGSWLVQHGKNLIAGLQNGIISIAKGIGGWVSRNVITPTVIGFTRAGTWLVSHGKNLVAGFKNGIVEIARSIGTWAYRNVIVPVVSPFARAGTWLTTEGANLIAGLKNGVVGQMKSIGSWVKSNVVDPVVSAVKKFFGIRSPSTVFAGIGGHLVAGLMKGLSTTSGTAIAKKVFGDMPSALRSIVGKGLISVSNLPKKALDALGSAVGIGAPLGGPSGNQSNEGVVRTLAAQYGWATGAQWNSLRALIMGESGFRNTAQNPTSSAYGLFQFLDSTWGTVGATKTSDPWAQTVAGLKYIARSYGSPANAYAKWSSRSPHWYEKGTPWVPNDQLAYLHKGEAVVPAEVNRRAIRMPSSGGTITLRVETGGSRMDDLLVELIRRYVRVNGGDVQAVLGR